MKNIIIAIISLSVLIIPGCTSSPSPGNKEVAKESIAAEPTPQDSIAAVRIVEDFFKAFDELDTVKIASLLLPTTEIVHHNGVITNNAQLIQVMNEAENWWPRVRKLSGIGYLQSSGLAVVTCLNEVTITLPDNKFVYEPYRETWILKKVENGWKPIRIHYSKIIAEKHSEEVN